VRVCQFHHFGNALWYPARDLRIRRQSLVSQTAVAKSNASPHRVVSYSALLGHYVRSGRPRRRSQLNRNQGSVASRHDAIVRKLKPPLGKDSHPSSRLFRFREHSCKDWPTAMTAHQNSLNDIPPAKSLRELAHDLSNALEIIMQSSFLLGTLDLGRNGRQWHQLLDGGIAQATAINAQLRAALRAEASSESR
jgi:hypothetical protein